MNATTNALLGCNGDASIEIPKLQAYLYASFLLIQLLLSVVGNILVCLAIVRFRHLRTLTNTFIFSLAVTDLLTPFVRVLYIAVSMFEAKWIFGCVWCKLSSVLGVLLCASSIMHLCAISIERFIVIKWPLRHHQWISKPRVAFVITNIWIVALLLSLFPYFGFVEHSFSLELLDCEISWTHKPEMALVLALFFFFFPFLVMSVTYYYIFKEVHLLSRRISTVRIADPPVVPNRRTSFGLKMRMNHIVRQELKAVKTIVVVIGAFFILWIPFFTVTAVRAYEPGKVSGAVQRLAFALAYSNSSCNWIIYSVMNREIREAFKVMLTKCGDRAPSSFSESVAKTTRRVYNAVSAVNAMRVAENRDKISQLQNETSDKVQSCAHSVKDDNNLVPSLQNREIEQGNRAGLTADPDRKKRKSVRFSTSNP